MMSRTFRRLKGDQSGHNYIVKRWSGNTRRPDLDVEVSRVRELAHYHSDAGWCMSVPGWFNNQQCTRPLRAMFRQFAHKVKTIADLEDTPVFPSRLRRPYYW
jgi:hypothetical protein